MSESTVHQKPLSTVTERWVPHSRPQLWGPFRGRKGIYHWDRWVYTFLKHFNWLCFDVVALSAHHGRNIPPWAARPLWAPTPPPGNHCTTPCRWTTAVAPLLWTTLTSILPPTPTALPGAASGAAWPATPLAAVRLRASRSRGIRTSATARIVPTLPPRCWGMGAWTGTFWTGRIHRCCCPRISLRRSEHQTGSIRSEQRPHRWVASPAPTAGAPWASPSLMFCLTSHLRCQALPRPCLVNISFLSHRLLKAHKMYIKHW